MYNDPDIVTKRIHFDYWLLMIVAALVAMGVIMVYSSSAVLASERYHNEYYFLKKEVIYAVAGFVLMSLAVKMPYRWWKKAAYPLLAMSFVMLVLVFIPPFKGVASGASRWIRLGPIAYQPSEFAKLAVIIFLAYSLEKKASRIKTFSIGFVPNAIIIGLFSLIILAQKDFGSAFTIAIVAGVMMFVSGICLKYLGASIAMVLPAIYFLIASVGYRRRRIMAFLNPWSDRYGSGFQILQSLVSFNEGGVLGRGLGEGRQKLFYLPEAHTDFVFSVLGEELGLIGVIVVIILFALFLWRAILIGLRAPDLFGRYLAFGIAVFISIQAVLNFCVVMGLLPTKGMVLPFISYGGSALTTMLLAVGVLLNISSYRRTGEDKS